MGKAVFQVGRAWPAGCFLVAAILALAETAAGQAGGAAAAFAPAATAVPVTPILQPALDQVRGALAQVRVDKWKKGNIREEASQNIDQIRKDLDGSLPPLQRAADAAPGSLSRTLPVSRNVSALYDVLLRVVEASRVTAPDDQVARLQDALVALGNARLKLADAMQSSAETMEKQADDLRATIRSEEAQKAAASAVPAAQPCTPAPARKTTRRTTTRKKPSPSTTAQPAKSSNQSQ